MEHFSFFFFFAASEATEKFYSSQFDQDANLSTCLATLGSWLQVAVLLIFHAGKIMEVLEH
jgi:hypothetical protein